MEDPYQILGLSKQATPEEIKSSFKKLSIKWHPDKNPTNKAEATEMFAKINNAYSILNDSKKKDVFDKFGHDGLQMLEKGMDPSMAQQTPFGFPFGMFPGFAHPGAGMHRPPQKCKPSLFKLRLSLAELYHGGTYKLHSPYKRECEACEGTGSASKKLDKCSTCKGAGFINHKNIVGPGMAQIVKVECKTCHGQGQCGDSKTNPCLICNGKTYTHKLKDIDFPVYPGMLWKMSLTLQGEGDELRDKLPGDLIVVILPPLSENDDDNEDDPTGSESDDSDQDGFWSGPTDYAFETSENDEFDGIKVLSKPKRQHNGDLLYRISIPLVNALTGLHYKFKHPGNGKVLVINHEDIIQPKSLYMIPENGMPILDEMAVTHRVPLDQLQIRYGSLLFEFNIIFPSKVSKKQAEVLQAVLGKGLESSPETVAQDGSDVAKKVAKGKKKTALPSSAPTNVNEVPVVLIPVSQSDDDENSDNESARPHGMPMGGGPQCAQQ